MNQTHQETASSATVTADTAGRETLPEAQRDIAPMPDAQIPSEIDVEIDVEMVVDLLVHRNSHLRRGAVYWTSVLALPVFGLILIAGVANREPVTICLSALAFTATSIMRSKAELLQQARTALLNTELGPEWLGALIASLEWPDRRVRGIVSLLLPLLLRRYASGESERMFSPEQHTYLYRRLTRRAVVATPAFALAILETLPEIGAEAALPHLQRLVALPGLSADLRRVRDAARVAQAAIERRIAQQRIQLFTVSAATDGEPPIQSHIDKY